MRNGRGLGWWPQKCPRDNIATSSKKFIYSFINALINLLDLNGVMDRRNTRR